MIENATNWNARSYFEMLVEENRLAIEHGFRFCSVSGLEGFEQALRSLLNAQALVCVSDTSDGYTELNNTPRTRRVKTVFLAMRHEVNDMIARERCFETMQELFRQFMTYIVRNRATLESEGIYIDPRITFTEIDRYFFSGCACAYFQIAVDKFTDLRFNDDEWL